MALNRVDLELETAKDLSEAVHRSIGLASMCWEKTPRGVFDSDKALQVGEQLMAYINENYTLKS